MILSTSGSFDEILSSMHFLKCGRVEFEMNDSAETEPEDVSIMLLTHKFILYALERDDWMMDFLELVNQQLSETDSLLSKPNLTVIKGGKCEL